MATCVWHVHASDVKGLIDSSRSVATFTCRVFYVDPESGDTYPMREELCEKDIALLVYDEPEPNLVCTVEGPDSLYWRGDGFSSTPPGVAGPLRYAYTFTNLEQDTIVIASIIVRVLDSGQLIGGGRRRGARLAPGASYTDSIEVDVRAIRFNREIVVEVAAQDAYDVPIRHCETRTFVPGVREVPCQVTGPLSVVWNTETGTSSPDRIPCLLSMENPLDTMRQVTGLTADLQQAVHLSVAPGDSLARAPMTLNPVSTGSMSWTFVIARPPVAHVWDTLAFAYVCDGVLHRCELIVEIMVIDENVTCAITAASSVTSDEVMQRVHIPLGYTFTNTGTVPVDVNRYVLDIAAGSGVRSEEPLEHAGATVAPGNDQNLIWNLHILAWRTQHTANLTVRAYRSDDAILAVCTHEIDIEGVQSPICRMNAVDTVRFNRDDVQYEPDPVPVTFMLDNLLDTEETNIEATIDLAQAPRLVLPATESASKTIALIDSHSTAGLTWQLIPTAAPIGELQEIVIRYRSDQQTEWKECSASIFIEAWPEEVSVTCATGGHDSLYSDAHYERFIPDPLHMSYTATNTGTVPLTGCEASIVLPPEFTLAGSDSTQSFTAPEYANQQGGPVSEGTLLPGASSTRWWLITPTSALTTLDPKQIGWIWASNEQGSGEGCAHTVQISPDNPPGIVLTPLHLRFEAERGGTLPTEQHIQLWTGGGLAMPWTAQPDTWYIDVNPVAGDHTAQLAVQPNTTALNKGMHVSSLEIAGTLPNLPKRIAVEYLITSLTGTHDAAAPAKLSLGPVYPHPIPIQSEARIIVNGSSGIAMRLALYDLLGRERAVIFDGVASGDEVPMPKPVSLGIGAGVYLLHVTTTHQMTTRMISVVKK
jgi:hypothetical protein